MKAWIERYCREHPESVAEFWRIVRFSITGGVSSLIHYGVYCLALLWMGVAEAYTIGYLVGLMCNYILTTFFTFQRHPSSGNAFGFVGIRVINYLLEIFLLETFLWLGLGEFVAPIAVMTIVVPINFLLLRYVFIHTKKHILFVREKGQMCYNIIQYGHVYAWAREHNKRIFSLCFAYKYQYFNICRTRGHNILTYAMVKLLTELSLMPVVSVENLLATEEEKDEALNRYAIMVVTGRHIRFFDLFEKYLLDIRHLFAFHDAIERQVAQLLAPYFSDERNILLGVHIRRGDDDNFLGGSYYYQDDVFIDAIRQFQAINTDRHIVAVVCGNVSLNKISFLEALPDITFVFPDGSPADDLCTLSHCDCLMGPPSFYSLVASMYHNVPLRFITNIHESFTKTDFHPFLYQLRHFDKYLIPS